MADDVVVVLPGIMGSTLKAADGTLVWAPSAGSVTRAVWNAIRNRKLMELREPVGDGPADDGIRPAGLMPDVHALPGLWTPVKGYTRLVNHLESLGYQQPDPGRPGNLLVVPYDWRLSNRHNGALLAGIVEPALERWRAQDGQADARLVFVCHSMGGLVASWYLHVEGGWGHTRKLITFGTPVRGAAKAADQLVHGAPGWLWRIGDWVTRLGRTLPSLHQLLPDYACVDDGTGTLTRLDPTRLPNTNTDLVADGLDFHTQLRDAVAATDRADDVHHMVGTRQPTTTTLTASGDGGIDALATYQNNELYGDGTVPIVGAAPAGMPLDSNQLWRIPDKHGNVHRNRTALDQLTGILQAPQLTPMGPEQGDTVRVDAPDLIQAGDDLTVTVTREAGRDAVVVTITDEHGNQTQQRPKLRGGQGTARFPQPAPGAHDIHITGPGPASSIAPVTHTCLVFDQPDDDPFDN